MHLPTMNLRLSLKCATKALCLIYFLSLLPLLATSFRLAFDIMQTVSVQPASDSPSIESNGSSCVLNSFHELCSSLDQSFSSDFGSGGDHIRSEEFFCHQDPEGFLKRKYRTHIPSKTQLETRALMHSRQIRSLSVGAAKKGICNDVVARSTVCTDREQLDLFAINSWISLVLATRGTDVTKVNGFEVIFAEHVLEHFAPMQVEVIAAASFMVLKPGGRFRIAVPDGYKPSPSYQQYVGPGSTPSGAGQKHMVSWTVDTLPPIFQKVGYEIERREYFAENGTFVSVSDAYDDADKLGKVSRSFRNDVRNKKPYKNFKSTLYVNDLRGGEPMYTSLWFDAIKPISCDYVFSP